MYKKLTPGISNKVGTYHITNNNGYNYRGAKIVCFATAVIADEQAYDFSELKQIITVEYCGDITYTRSDRNQDEYEARKDFDKARKKTTSSSLTAKNNSDILTGQKVFSPLDLSHHLTNTITDLATSNCLWPSLNTYTTGKIADVGTTTEKLGRVTTASTVNTLTTETNYLKLNNLPKINIEEKKEKKSMFENLMKDLHFGKADPKMSIYGPAFLAQGICAKEYTAYDKATNRWMDVTDMTFDFPTFMMPVAKDNIKSGDYIGHRGPNGNYEWVRVMQIYDDVIEAESPSRHEVISILPTRNMFGFDFYTKLIIPFDMGSTFGGASASNPFGMLPMFMMMNDKDKDKSGSDDNSMLMAMMMMQNGGMDFASNPMMLYALMGDKGGDNPMLMAMLMSQMMQGAPTKSACDCDHN